MNGGGIDIMRQQSFEILIGFGKRQLLKNMSQVSMGRQAVGLGGLDQTEESGTGGGPVRTSGKSSQPRGISPLSCSQIRT